MLTPRSDDPNRQKELDRKQRDPASFGATVAEGGKPRGSETQRKAETELESNKKK